MNKDTYLLIKHSRRLAEAMTNDIMTQKACRR